MGVALLFLTTFIWGTAFLAQKFGADSLGPFTLTCFRNILGGGFLLALILIRRHRIRKNSRTIERSEQTTRSSVLAGVLCGIPLLAAMIAQQIGIEHTTPGISAFLTTNYMFFIPVLCLVVYRQLPRWHVWGGVAVAIAGTYLICLSGEGDAGVRTVGRGELWTILCAFLFAVQMMVVDRYAKRCDVLMMSATQLVTGAVLASPFLLLPSEFSRLSAFHFQPSACIPVVYLGIFSSGIAYTLQNFGQARTSPALAGVILSMESVFGALSGYVVLGDRMTVSQFSGCALVFLAAVLTQLLEARKSTNENF